MAKRIAIVLSQLKSASPAQRELEGTVVAELLMVHGLEVTLVSDLTTLGEDDTGILCLEGITGDMVMLSWMPSGEAHQRLAKLGVQGRLGRTALGGGNVEYVGHGSTRKIYHIDLRSVHEVQQLCAEIERIRGEAAVQVIDLGLTSGAQAKPSAATDSPLASPQDPSPTSPSPSVRQENLSKPKASSEAEFDDDDPELDELMKQFDAWDV